MSIIAFLLKTTLVFIALFSLYQVFIKESRHLRIRRWYLNSMLFVSFLIAFISPLVLPYYYSEPWAIFAWPDAFARSLISSTGIDELLGDDFVVSIIVIACIISFIWVTLKNLYYLFILRKFLKGSPILSKTDEYIIRTGSEGDGCFCFHKTIYLHSPSLSEQNYRIVLEHEKAHIRQKHYLDLWLSVISDYFFWLYPFNKRYQRALEEVLECLADKETIEVLHIKPITYQAVLYSSIEYSNMRPVLCHAFERSMIAQRILFFSRKRSNPRKMPFKLLLSLLIACILTFSVMFIDIWSFQVQKLEDKYQVGYNLGKVITSYVPNGKHHHRFEQINDDDMAAGASENDLLRKKDISNVQPIPAQRIFPWRTN